MRPEKQFLVDEVNNHLEKSDYLFLADYERANVMDIAELRGQLVKEEAEFHVVKNNILKVAAKGRGLPSLDDQLTGRHGFEFIVYRLFTTPTALKDNILQWYESANMLSDDARVSRQLETCKRTH